MPMLHSESGPLTEDIEDLKKTRGAVILAHYYQRASVQHLADFTGDSLELSRQAVQTRAEVIVFCGVRFMAETASILNPQKVVLLPEPTAGCSLAESASAEQVRRRLEEMPAETALVSYVNSSAEVKAISDICCTSANAVEVVQSVPQQRVLFVPDRNLAAFAAERTDKEVVPWDGRCYVHDPNISTGAVRDLKRQHHDALVMVHPECSGEVRRLADFVGSTSQLLDFATNSDRQRFIVGTEEGLQHPLQERNPHKDFYFTGSVCASMRLTTLNSIRRALDRMTNVVSVDEQVRQNAMSALERMLAV